MKISRIDSLGIVFDCAKMLSIVKKISNCLFLVPNDEILSNRQKIFRAAIGLLFFLFVISGMLANVSRLRNFTSTDFEVLLSALYLLGYGMTAYFVANVFYWRKEIAEMFQQLSALHDACKCQLILKKKKNIFFNIV